MKVLALILALVTTIAAACWAGPINVSSNKDPFTIVEFPGQPAGNSDARGRALQSSAIPNTWAVIVLMGQSLPASNATGSYTTVSANAQMLSIYGGIYPCANPVLGASVATSLGSNGPSCIIADGLISGGAFPGVLMVPIAIDGTSAADWNSPQLSTRITATWNRLAAIGLKPTYILYHQGQQDQALNLNTNPAAYTASVQSTATQWRNLGYTGNFIVALETMVSNTTDSNIRTAQANTVNSGLCIVQGADTDTLTTGTNRQADGTHLTQTGNSNYAGLDVTVITNLHNSPHC